MAETKIDRRVQRTKQHLFQALAELVAEKGYNAITVQDIAERANIGRTTFYTHFSSKDALFINAHFVDFEPFIPEEIKIEDLLAEAPSEPLIALFEQIQRTRSQYVDLMMSADMAHFQREVRAHFAGRLEAGLRKNFSESESKIPLPMLANYLASSQIAFIFWWVECHAPYNAREMAESYQRMQRAVLHDALGPL